VGENLCWEQREKEGITRGIGGILWEEKEGCGGNFVTRERRGEVCGQKKDGCGAEERFWRRKWDVMEIGGPGRDRYGGDRRRDV
jgi:hypothetical protein